MQPVWKSAGSAPCRKPGVWACVSMCGCVFWKVWAASGATFQPPAQGNPVTVWTEADLIVSTQKTQKFVLFASVEVSLSPMANIFFFLKKKVCKFTVLWCVYKYTHQFQNLVRNYKQTWLQASFVWLQREAKLGNERCSDCQSVCWLFKDTGEGNNVCTRVCVCVHIFPHYSLPISLLRPVSTSLWLSGLRTPLRSERENRMLVILCPADESSG